MTYWLGQLCGLVSAIGCIIVPFFHHKWQMLLDVVITNLLIALNFVLIGQFGSAALMCTVATVQGLIALIHNQRGTKAGKAEIGIFTLLYLVFGFYGLVSRAGYVPGVNAGNLLELMPICGALLNMVFILVKNPSSARRVLLVTNLIWVTYSAIAGAAAVFAQLITLMTTLYAMYRYRHMETV